jgi:hypothetical protein
MKLPIPQKNQNQERLRYFSLLSTEKALGVDLKNHHFYDQAIEKMTVDMTVQFHF